MSPAPARRPIRVMLVDDHPVMRVGLASVLSASHGFTIVAEADSGVAAIDLFRQHRPDVVLMDVSMERLDGIETLRRLRGECADARVIMLTSSRSADDAAASVAAGASGYLVKTVPHTAIAEAIRAVHAGARLAPPAAAPTRRGPLSEREAEVLGLVRQGLSNDEIADRLGISERTVRAHVSAILAALGAADRAQAVALGFELGILRPSVRPGG